MNFFDKFKDRYKILVLVLFILIFALSFRLAVLTIARGDDYRERADNLRLREVEMTAPRGEIRDRNGKLLAGNVPRFTVQLFKDELNRYDNTKDKKLRNVKKNDAFLKLTRLIEEDGVEYEDDFPLKLNVFEYENEEDYDLENQNPIDKVIDILVENNLVKDVLNSYFVSNEYEGHYKYIVANRTLSVYKKKGMDIPIDFEITEEGLVSKFTDDEQVEIWKKNNNIPKELGPIDSIINLINDDRTVIMSTINNNITRKIVYDILSERGLTDNIVLEDFALSYEKEYYTQKRKLSKQFDFVTKDTKGVEDFANIFYEVGLKDFLETSYESPSDKKKYIYPGEILIKLMEDKKVEVDVKVVKDRKNKGEFKYEHKDNEFMPQDDIIDYLAELAYETKVMKDFVSHKDVKAKAQSQLLNNGINAKIAVSGDEVDYVYINELKRFLDEHLISKEKYFKNYENILDIPKEKIYESLVSYYNIDNSLSKYEILPILNVYSQIKKQGYLAYKPINIAYGIKDDTVAKIEEHLMEVPGIEISIEPVRYYPEGKTAAHILGYLGKISQANEIEKYVDEQGYSKNEIIGKTGIEESMQHHLRGTTGSKKVEVDPLGNTIKEIGSETVKAVPGDNVYLSIDLDLQKVAEDALEQTLLELQKGGTFKSEWGDFKFGTKKGRPYKNAKSGAVVAIDVKTGQVLASASYPPYDPNLFSTGISSTDWSSLFPEDESDTLAPRPLYNIATQTAIQPGSIYKMLTGLTALEKGLSPNKKIRDMGYIEVGTDRFNCLAWTMSRRTHGNVDISEALRDSCNYYFYTLALGENQRTREQLGVKVEVEDLVNMARKLGLDDRTGIEINVPKEVAVGVPDPEKKKKLMKSLFRNELNATIHNYYKEGVTFNEDEKKELIEEIVSWMDKDTIMTRQEVGIELDKLNIDGEKVLPNKREGLMDIIKYTYLNKVTWDITDTLNLTIGQGQNAYTPIQMANYISIISNGGYRHKLTLLENIRNYNNSEEIYSHEVESERIELNDYSNLEAIKRGMYLAAKDGTALRTFNNFPVEVGVKTGTAEKKSINPVTKEPYDDFAWFVGFAPYDEPEIAVATVLFQGGSGGYAGPLVREIFAEYLGLNKLEETDNLPFKNYLSQ